MGWIISIALIVYIIYISSKSDNSSDLTRKPINNSYVKKNYVSPIVNKRINEEQIYIDKIKLGNEQQKIFDRIENSKEHFFITGKAGTGKSILLQYLKYKTNKKLVVGAFTGVAALNVGGQTLHSLFNIPTGFIDVSELRISARVSMLIRHIDMVVIDEISMVRADMMEAINVLLQQAKGNKFPFGGIQMIMFGDPYQLPPVADRGEHEYFAHNNGGPYFFNAPIWKYTKINIFELTYNFRQKDDQTFRNILNAVRKNEIEESVLETLNQRCVVDIPCEGVVTLATRNDIVKEINENKLNQISSQEFVYKAEISGNLSESYFPTEEFLMLKKGAQVMLLKNDSDGRWVNGTVGVIDSLSQMEIKVKINGEIVYSIPKVSWTKIRYYYNQETRKIEEEVLSTFTQYPLRLAWAFTIHKSQGKTYNSVIVNMGGGAFAHGQTYVALSRCTTLGGLYLTQPISREDIQVDPLVTNFMEQVTIEDI